MKKKFLTAIVLAVMFALVTFMAACGTDVTFKVVTEFDSERGSVVVAGEDGSEKSEFATGAKVVVTVSAADGYALDAFTVNGVDTELINNVYDFYITANTVVKATFKPDDEEDPNKKPDDDPPAAHEHKWSKWVVEDPKPTDKLIGKATRTCSGEGSCGAEDTDKVFTLPALNETDYEVTVVKAATCTEKGKVTYAIDVNGESVGFDVVTEVKPQAHKYGEYVKNDAEGHYKVCGFNSEHKTAVDDHDEEGEDGACSVCGFKPRVVHEHSWSEWTVEKAPTEELTGKATRTCSGDGSCGATDSDKVFTLPVLGSESYTVGDDSATCTAAGKVTYTIDINDEAVGFDVDTEVKQHELTHHDAVEATCVAGVVEYWECGSCGKYFNSDDANAAEVEAENLVVSATAKHTYVFEQSYHAKVAATCLTDGKSLHYECTVCHLLFADINFKNQEPGAATPIAEESLVLPATGHSLTHYNYKDPTCAATGNVEYWKCTNSCKKYYSDEAATTEISSSATTIAKKPHGTMTHTAAVDPTCEQAGNKEYWTCDVCDKNYTTDAGTSQLTSVTVAALGHSCTYEVTTLPAKTTAGAANKACTRCDYADTVSLLALNSGIYTVTNEQKPTCFEGGHTSYEVTYTDGKCAFTLQLEALNHGNLQSVAAGAGTVANKGAVATTTPTGTALTYVNVQAYWYCPDCQNIYADANCAEEAVLEFKNARNGRLLSYGENVFSVANKVCSYQAFVTGTHTFTLDQNFSIIAYANETKTATVYSANAWKDGSDMFDKDASAEKTVVVNMKSGEIIIITGVATFSKVTVSCNAKLVFYGDNSVEVTQANASVAESGDIYYFGSAEAKVYSITIPKGVAVEIGENGSKGSLEAFDSDLADGETVSKNFEVAAFETVKLTFIAAKAGTYTVTIGEAVWPTLSLGETLTIPNTDWPAFGESITYKVDRSVEEGTYYLTMTEATGRGACYIAVNFSGTIETQGSNVPKQDDWIYCQGTRVGTKVTVTLKGNDTITIINPANGTVGTVTFTLTAA